jgi:hypothetical protein
VTKVEIEALQNALDKIGAGLDAIADMICEIETKANKRKAAAKAKTKKGNRKSKP